MLWHLDSMGYIQMSKASVLWLNSIVMCHFVSAGVTFPEFPSLYGSEELGLVQETSVWSGRQGEAELLCSEVGLGSQAPLQLEHGELTAKNNTRLTSKTTTGGPLHSWVDASGRDGGNVGGQPCSSRPASLHHLDLRISAGTRTTLLTSRRNPWHGWVFLEVATMMKKC